MTKNRLFVLLCALLVLVGSACGGEDGPDSVPSDAVAVVGEETISKQQFDTVLDQARRGYGQQKRQFPKAGSAEYEQLKGQILQFLVQRAQFEQKAEELDVEVSDEQVDARLKQVKQQYFRGNEAAYKKQLRQQGLSEQQLRNDIRAQLLSERIFREVTSKVEVTDQEVRRWYEQNQKNYRQPASREVRHILVKQRALAERLHRQLRRGASFTRLARRFSEDPGSKRMGGKLTVARGQTVKPFDRVAFSLRRGALSRPVKTQFGYHLIKVESRTVPPFDDKVSAQARQKLARGGQEKVLALLQEAAKKADIAVDPRYGTFNKEGNAPAVVPPQAPGTTIPTPPVAPAPAP